MTTIADVIEIAIITFTIGLDDFHQVFKIPISIEKQDSLY